MLIYSVKSNINYAKNNGSNINFVQNIQKNIIHAKENKSDIKYAQSQEKQSLVNLTKEPETLEDLEEDISVTTALSKVNNMIEIWNERREKKKKVCKKTSETNKATNHNQVYYM